MTLNQYIVDTEPAVRGILDLIHREQNRIAALQKAHFSADEEAIRIFNSIKQAGGDSVLLINLYECEQAKKQYADETERLKRIMATFETTYNSLAGALLQIAKQGISAAYGGLHLCPNGRIVGKKEHIKNIIWQARNQSMHFEEGKYNSQVQQCFSNLVADFGACLTLDNKNKALAILGLLGWTEYKVYESDMNALLPQ